MTLIGKTKDNEDTRVKNNKIDPVPSVYKKNSNEISFKKALIIATILHPAFVAFVALVVLILAIFGIELYKFNRPELPKKDIEFVLVTKEATPINKNTRFRSDKNSRAGGIHDPNRPVSEPQPQAPKAPAKKPAAAAPKVVQPQKTKTAPVQKPQQKQITQKPQDSKPVAKSITKTTAPAPSVPRPTRTSPKPTLAPKSTMQIPFPKTKDYSDIGPASGGPIAGSKSGSGTSSGNKGTSVASAPSPSFSPSKSGSGRTGSSRGTTGGTGSSGNYGNPGPGNPKGVPGIDAIREPDFGPYMKELQRRIKMNWAPPKGNESKRVVLLFSISRDGRLLSVKVHKSSGLPAADEAALHAVRLTAPFRPLPPDYKGSSVDIQFTFDYNVFSASRY